VGARALFELALAIYEKALGPEHPSTATSLNNLAALLQAQGDLAGARPLYERALAIRSAPSIRTRIVAVAILHDCCWPLEIPQKR
jgi:tetratricopeptide (TPR) repeat protein